MSNPEGSRPALATWYDRKEFVMVDFNVGESRDVNVEFQDYKITFSCVAGDDNIRYYNEIELYEKLIHLDCRFKVFDRHIHCTLRKAKGAIDWLRLTKDKEKPTWLSTDFDNWRDWREENDEGMARYVDFQKTLKEITDKNKVVPTMDDLDDDDEDVLSTQASDEFPVWKSRPITQLEELPGVPFYQAWRKQASNCRAAPLPFLFYKPAV